jgi:hypothetical protein
MICEEKSECHATHAVVRTYCEGLCTNYRGIGPTASLNVPIALLIKMYATYKHLAGKI